MLKFCSLHTMTIISTLGSLAVSGCVGGVNGPQERPAVAAPPPRVAAPAPRAGPVPAAPVE